MGRNATTSSVQILYIGRIEPSYDKVWQGIQQEGGKVVFARTQVLGLQLARELQPSIVIINTVNSHFSGSYLCKMLGRRLPQACRLLLTERGEGADTECEERLVRPFTNRKLRDTIRRLTEATAPNILRAGPLELNVVSRVVVSPPGRAHLTPKQCKLLAAFMVRPNQVLSRQALMQDIWDTHYLGDTRTLDVHIRWLRERIETDPMHPTLLVTQRGVGYKLVVPGAEDSTPASDEAEPEPVPDQVA